MMLSISSEEGSGIAEVVPNVISAISALPLPEAESLKPIVISVPAETNMPLVTPRSASSKISLPLSEKVNAPPSES